jgi:hypothetical protein
MTADTTRRDLLAGLAMTALAIPSPALAIDGPAWEADIAARLFTAAQLRRVAANRLNSGRDFLARWERRNPFPIGQGVAVRHVWAQGYCEAFTAAGMSQRVAARDATRAACEALCRDALALAGDTLADRQALARLLPYDAGGILKDALLARAAA